MFVPWVHPEPNLTQRKVTATGGKAQLAGEFVGLKINK